MAAESVWLTRKRLDNQGLSRIRFRSAPEVVRWFVAVQSQDFGGAKWGVGQRLPGVADAAIEQAFDAGAILRTHVMRPTWHFVAPEDLRWLLALTAPRVHRANGFNYRTYEIDAPTVRRSRNAIERALDTGGYLTREELGGALRRAKISFDGIRLAHLVMDAELEGIICSGPRRGKQFTYALTGQRVPNARRLTREESLVELTRRYFSSHGPATARDFAWWSGLSLRDARTGLAALQGSIGQQSLDGCTYWFVPSRKMPGNEGPLVHLLPNFDEATVAYKDRAMPGSLPKPANAKKHGHFPHQLLVEGQVAGGWRRTITSRRVTIEVLPYRALTRTETGAVSAATDAYGRFVNAATSFVVL